MSAKPAKRSIILASRSPRRIALLRDAGIAFTAIPPKYDEPDMSRWQLSPVAFAESVSHYKARSLADEHPESLILGADTVVALAGKLFGKPVDVEDARRILVALTGTTHEVITGITLYEPATGRRRITHETTRVTMRAMSASQLEEYLDSGEWQGKAGAYGIQDSGDAFVERTEGSFSNVVGLPMELVMEVLAEFGVTDPTGVPPAAGPGPGRGFRSAQWPGGPRPD